MKRTTLLLLVALLALGAVFFVTKRKTAEKVSIPYELKVISDLSRVEVTRPGDSGPESFTLTTKDGAWWIEKPFQALVDESLQMGLIDTFGKTVKTDDLQIGIGKKDAYELSEEKAIVVAVFGANEGKAALKFSVGKVPDIKNVQIKRSYILADDGEIYRARTDLSSVFRKPLKQLRSKVIQQLASSSAISKVVFEGEHEFTLEKEGDEWKLIGAGANEKLDGQTLQSLLNALAGLTAADFGTGSDLSAFGLDPHKLRITTHASEKTSVLLMGVSPEGKRFVMKESDGFVYQLPEHRGKSLDIDRYKLRDRLSRSLDQASLTRIRFANGVLLRRKGEEGWMLKDGSPVLEDKIAPVLGTLSKLRVKHFVDPAGHAFAKEASVELQVGSTRHTLLLGPKIGETGDRLARWSDSDALFVLAESNTKPLYPSRDELKGES
jgi:hypothetical protein